MRIIYFVWIGIALIIAYSGGYYWYDKNYVQMHPDYYIVGKDGSVELLRMYYGNTEGNLRYCFKIYEPILNVFHDSKRVPIDKNDAAFLRLKKYADETAVKNSLVGKYNRMEIWEQGGELVVSYRYDQKFIQLYWNGIARF